STIGGLQVWVDRHALMKSHPRVAGISLTSCATWDNHQISTLPVVHMGTARQPSIWRVRHVLFLSIRDAPPLKGLKVASWQPGSGLRTTKTASSTPAAIGGVSIRRGLSNRSEAIKPMR